MSTKINVAGVWKEPTPSINVAGVWKTPDNIKINVSGVWKEVYSGGPTVNISANGRVNYRYGAICYGGAYYLTTGLEYEYTATAGGSNVGTWLTSGSNSEVWVQWVRTGGTLSAWNSINPGTGRLQMSSSRYYRASRNLTGISTIIGYFRMYDAASGGNLLDTGATGTYSMEYDFDACPLCCFTPETLVRMASGLDVPIGQLKAGDKVLIKRPENGEMTWEKIGEIIEVSGRTMYTMYFEDGSHFNVSDDHPISVEGKGYAAINPVYTYKNLGLDQIDTVKVGDLVTTLSGPSVRITKIVPLDYPGTVITLSNSFWFANGKLVY